MRLWTLIEKVLFPPFCLLCENSLENKGSLFCLGCSGFFELIDPMTRCPFCFVEGEGRRPCERCIKKRQQRVQIASACDAFDPVKRMVLELKRGGYPFLAKTAAAFMTIQFFHLGWPIPEGIVSIPSRSPWKGGDTVFQIAKILAKNLNTKHLPILRRRMGDFPASRVQGGASTRSFFLRKAENVEDKILLLVDDEVISGETFRKAAEVLREGFPKRVYALSFARQVGEGYSRLNPK